MKPATEIAKLCELWWSTFSDSTKVEQSKYASQFLKLLGWHDIAPVDYCADSRILTYILRSDSQVAIATYFLMPSTLEPPSALHENNLDFCPMTRKLVDASNHLDVGYALITDMHRYYLYDIHTDELLLHADAPMEFNKVFGEILSKADIDRGSLDEIRRHPRSYVARQLREWCLEWADALSGDSKLSKDIIFIAIDRLIVMRFIFTHDILKRSGKPFKKRYDELIKTAFSQEPEGCGKMLTSLFHDFWLDWNADIFAPLHALDSILEDDCLAAELVGEFALLSNGKFSIATVLESFNFGDASEKARVRMVPDEDEERDRYLMKQTIDTIDETRVEVDIMEEGYRSIFPWFDKLIGLYSRIETEFNAKAFDNHNHEEVLDLFDWSEKDSQRPEAIKNKYNHAVEHGFTIFYKTPRQKRTCQLMLYLHLISRFHQNKQRFIEFPQIGKALNERPTFKKSDKRWIYSPTQDPEKDEWDIG